MGAGKEKNCRLGTVGGQAVMEGVMMKSREGVAIAVRRMDDKRIVVRKKDYKPLKEKCAFFRIPVIRGIVNFVDMMRLSLSTMTASADMLGLEEEGEPSKFEKWLDKHFGKSIMAVASALGVVLGVALALLLFMYLPIKVVGLVEHFAGDIGWWRNLVEGGAKMLIFVLYLLVVSLIPDIRRVFQYHGAEHKVIHAFEAGGDVDAATAARMSRLHPRCGTTFLLFVIGISIILHAVLVPLLLFFYCPEGAVAKQALTIVFKLLLMVPISALAYELIRYAARMPDGFMATLLRAPGLTLQRMTTAEPDERQLDVAVVALREALGAQAGDNIITAPYRRDA